MSFLPSMYVCQNSHDQVSLSMQGKTFTEAAVPKTSATWMIENAIARYSSPSNGTDMHVQLFRTRTGTTLQSWSTDEGKTWSFPQNSTLPNPNSRVCIPMKTHYQIRRILH